MFIVVVVVVDGATADPEIPDVVFVVVTDGATAGPEIPDAPFVIVVVIGGAIAGPDVPDFVPLIDSDTPGFVLPIVPVVPCCCLSMSHANEICNASVGVDTAPVGNELDVNVS